jgi:hypothetical protein
MTGRPLPPEPLRREGIAFVPAPDVLAFLERTFLQEGAPFWRKEYSHLEEARIGVLWTNVERVKDGLLTLGMAQLVRISGDKWTSGRSAQQLREWFGDWWDAELDPYPDFVLIFYGPAAAEMNDATFCALLSHELRHCGQKRDRYGELKFDENGDPEFAMQGHDVEEFISVVEDFGIAAAGPAAVKFVEAAQRRPRFSAAEVAGVCGCGARLQAVA